MASALAYAGYDYKFVTGDKDHDMIQGGSDSARRPALALARLSPADSQARNAPPRRPGKRDLSMWAWIGRRWRRFREIRTGKFRLHCCFSMTD